MLDHNLAAIAGGAGLARAWCGKVCVSSYAWYGGSAAYGASSERKGRLLDRGAKAAATTGSTSAALGKAGDVILPNVSSFCIVDLTK